ncbi:MAG TPA: phosphoglyceromutase [Frankiaceae bacterium]|nr:phosphoglyceromutase [Frankiaceae bacterium]
MATLLLLRHGQSEWNRSNQFTGWVDVALSEQGLNEARRGGALMREKAVLPDVLHTSLLTRAIHTATLSLEECGRQWIPVRRSWRLNERHYGALQGLDKAATKEKFGDAQFMLWRRSYDIPPPEIEDGQPSGVDERYADLAPDVIPLTECLKDVLVRMLPYWYDDIVPDLKAGRTTLVAAHGNSLRALVKHLEGISDDAIAGLNIPTGIPLRYELDSDLRVVDSAYLDPEAAAAGAAAVKDQGSK